MPPLSRAVGAATVSPGYDRTTTPTTTARSWSIRTGTTSRRSATRRSREARAAERSRGGRARRERLGARRSVALAPKARRRLIAHRLDDPDRRARHRDEARLVDHRDRVGLVEEVHRRRQE